MLDRVRVLGRGLVIVALALGVTAGPASAVSPGDWAQEGFDAGRTGFNPLERELRPATVGELELAWASRVAPGSWYIVGQPVWTSPIVSDGAVYAAPTGWSVEGDGFFRSLEVSTGDRRWTSRDVNVVTASAAVGARRVFVSASYPWELTAFRTRTGAVAWSQPTIPSSWEAGEGEDWEESAPVLAGGRVYVMAEATREVDGVLKSAERLWARDARTGELVWRRRVGSSYGTLAVARGTLIAALLQRVLAVDAATGETRWRARVAGREAALTGNRVYIAGADVAALDAETGSILWRRDMSGHGIAVAPVRQPDGNTIRTLFVVKGPRAVLVALRADDGARLWRAEPTGVPSRSEPRGVRTPAVANRVVFVLAVPARVLAFSAVTGERLWRGGLGARPTSPPAVANGMVFVGTEDGRVLAFSLPEG